MSWRQRLVPRQQYELAFAEVYRDTFHHGTDGHHRLMLIALLAEQIEEHSVLLHDLRTRIQQLIADHPASHFTMENGLDPILADLDHFLDYGSPSSTEPESCPPSLSLSSGPSSLPV